MFLKIICMIMFGLIFKKCKLFKYFVSWSNSGDAESGHKVEARGAILTITMLTLTLTFILILSLTFVLVNFWFFICVFVGILRFWSFLLKIHSEFAIRNKLKSRSLLRVLSLLWVEFFHKNLVNINILLLRVVILLRSFLMRALTVFKYL